MYHVSAILAIDENGGAGYNNDLPWPKIAVDMRYFANVTRGQIVVMGRKTWESIGSRALKDRVNVVLSRSDVIVGPDVTISELSIKTLDSIVAHYNKNVFVIGGPKIIEDNIDIFDAIHITHVDGTYECDTFFDKSILNRFRPYSVLSYGPEESPIPVQMIKYHRTGFFTT